MGTHLRLLCMAQAAPSPPALSAPHSLPLSPPPPPLPPPRAHSSPLQEAQEEAEAKELRSAALSSHIRSLPLSPMRGRLLLLTQQTFPVPRDAPPSRKRTDGCRANVCKPGAGLQPELRDPQGDATHCARPQAEPPPPSPLQPRSVLGAESQDVPRCCSKQGRPRRLRNSSLPKDSCSLRFLPTSSPSCAMAPHGSQVRPFRMSPPPPSFPAPRWLQPCSRRLQRASEGVACFHLPAYGTGGILVGSRNPAAVGERPRPAVSVLLCLGSRGKTTRSYFGFYGSRESPRPSAGSEGEAPRQGLSYPPRPPLGGVHPLNAMMAHMG